MRCVWARQSPQEYECRYCGRQRRDKLTGARGGLLHYVLVDGVWRVFAGGARGEPMPSCPKRRDVTASELLAEGTREIPRLPGLPRPPGYKPPPKKSGPNVDMDGSHPSEGPLWWTKR